MMKVFTPHQRLRGKSMDELDIKPKVKTLKPQSLIRGAGFTKIENFHLFLIFTVLILLALGVFTFRVVFSGLKTAGQLDEELLSSEIHIDQGKLNQAHEAFFNREKTPLDFTK